MSPADPIHAADLETSVEALLFASPQPLTVAEIHEVFPQVAAVEIEAALAALQSRYEEPGRALRIVAVAGGFRMTTRPEHAESLARLFQARNRSRLSPAALEVLAVVAYRQPVTAPEVQEIRGVDCQTVLKKLLERRLLRIVGRKPVVGRPLLYGTTREFLIHFGLNSLADLPQVEELNEALPASGDAPPEPADAGAEDPQLEAEPIAAAGADGDGDLEAGQNAGRD
jgi:segregation and condensation protein B